MDFTLTEEQKALKKEFDDFFSYHMENSKPEGYSTSGLESTHSDVGNKFHRFMMKEIAKKKWNIMAWPEEYGGRSAPIIEQVLFAESQSYHGAPGIDGFGVKMFAPTLILHATEEQKQRILPPIANGDLQYSQGWSEPNAGSDLASLTTMAIKEGDQYIINGQKTWTTGAHHADMAFLLARTDPESTRSRGLSVFNIDLTLPGITRRPILYMNGAHIVNEVFFDNVKVSVDERIGVEGDGWKYTRDTMNFERSSAGVYAGMKRQVEGLIQYLKENERDGKPLAEHSSVRKKLADLYMDIEVGRALAYKIAWLQEVGKMQYSPSAASESKVFATELRQRLCHVGSEMMGLYGMVEDSPWAPLGGSMPEGYQTTIGSTVCAGSNEIQRNIIAWVGCGLPRFK
ncbi:acyl-CoA dehydrogenase family protein [Thermodesulfobacteriota bacterium]